MRSTAVALTLLLTSVAIPAQSSAQVANSSWRVGNTANEARYRVRELLAGREFENDAVGATQGVSGIIRFDSSSNVMTDSSSITIDLTTLESDKSRRDGYLQRRTLDTESHPNATLQISAIVGLPEDLPEGEEINFVLEGDLSIKGVSFATTWEVVGTLSDGHLNGTAFTSFTFEEAQLDKPSVMSVLTVHDTIKLEYDFHFIRQ